MQVLHPNLSTVVAGHESCQGTLAGRSADRAKKVPLAWCSEVLAQPPPRRLPVIMADMGRTTVLTDTMAVTMVASVAMVGMRTDQQGPTDMLNSGERRVIAVVTITKRSVLKWTNSMRVDVAEAVAYLTPMLMIPQTMSMLTRAVGGSSMNQAAATMRANCSQRASLSVDTTLKTTDTIRQRTRGPTHDDTPPRRTATLRDLHLAETGGIRNMSVSCTTVAANSEYHCREGEAWPCRS